MSAWVSDIIQALAYSRYIHSLVEWFSLANAS